MTRRRCRFLLGGHRANGSRWATAIGLAVGALFWPAAFLQAETTDAAQDRAKPAEGASSDLAAGYGQQIRPLLQKYCLDCHSTAKKKGDLDLERFTSLDDTRREVEVWHNVLEMLESGQMPPEDAPQPTGEHHDQLIGWTRRLLDAEILARAGDPGRVIVRRLSNTQYDNTIRDLTGQDLRPTHDFPADGAAGEGFTNSGDGLVMSPVLLGKYWNAAKQIAAHAVLVPDGFHFSPSTTRADWSQESIARIRALYGEYGAGASEGRLDFVPYLKATLANRFRLQTGETTITAIAAKNRLNPKYLGQLWRTLTVGPANEPLAGIRQQWRRTKPDDVEALADRIRVWQPTIWKFNKIGSYVETVWQQPVEPTTLERQSFKLKPKLQPGQTEVRLYLGARTLLGDPAQTQIVWQEPRFEASGQAPIRLRDLRQNAGGFASFHRALFSETAKYLAAALALARDPKLVRAQVAASEKLDPMLLKNWTELAGLSMGVVPLETYTRPLPDVPSQPTVKGWGTESGDHLPHITANSSGEPVDVPGHMLPHSFSIHPSPSHFGAVVWNSPLTGRVRIEAKVVHAHPPGGNGVVWWIEHRHDDRADRLDGDAIGSGQPAHIAPIELNVGPGSRLVLAVGSRGGDVNSDLTDVDLTVTELADPGRKWNLGQDCSDSILAANPHPDRLGNPGVWQFVLGLDPQAVFSRIPTGSQLAAWRAAALDNKPLEQLKELAEKVQAVLSGERPSPDRVADRQLFDNLQSPGGPLLEDLDTAHWLGKPGDTAASAWGLPREQFGPGSAGGVADENSLVSAAKDLLEIRVPAAIFENYEFITDASLSPASERSVVQVEVSTDRPDLAHAARENRPCLKGAKVALSADDTAALRAAFPFFLFYSKVVPDDETIDLRMHFREDDQLARLFLNEAQVAKLDRAWAELPYVSQSPLAELKYYPTFMGFVSQDGPEELARVRGRTEEQIHRQGEAFEHELNELAPSQLDTLVKFADQVYRRPLAEVEQNELRGLYRSLREKKEMSHEDAWRTTLASLLTSPMFLYRVESAPPGSESQPVSNFELATRLSYFLWATTPDAELASLAAAGKLTDPEVLKAQTSRMLKDGKVRGLATEFGTQWLHVRDIQNNREKNEKLFPTFDDALREALFEESAQLFQYLVQADRPVLEIFDADYTFVNETLAKHYGIPGVEGPQWRKVDGVKKYGRGGVLGLASVLTAQSGASRTSPVLRGNWLLETLLGEKIPKPPANVPRLPDEETGGDNLTVRQMVEKHARVPECAVCHERFDPFGFALEKYDAIGRLREVDLAGRPITTDARLKDGSQFDGLDGLRKYLVEKRKDMMLRHFCTKLLGYALGRTVSLSDRPLVDRMIAELEKNDYRASAAILPIVESQQFCNHRGMDATKEE